MLIFRSVSKKVWELQLGIHPSHHAIADCTEEASTSDLASESNRRETFSMSNSTESGSLPLPSPVQAFACKQLGLFRVVQNTWLLSGIHFLPPKPNMTNLSHRRNQPHHCPAMFCRQLASPCYPKSDAPNVAFAKF